MKIVELAMAGYTNIVIMSGRFGIMVAMATRDALLRDSELIGGRDGWGRSMWGTTKSSS